MIKKAMKNKIIIVGAGMAGCFMALNLAKRDYDVELYEHRPDVRKEPYDSGRSFNLTLYYRGILAMQKAGIWDEIKKIAVIAEGNAAHYSDTKVVYDPFDGQADEILFTVHRNVFNGTLLDIVEKTPGIKVFFNTRCVGINKDKKTAMFQKSGGGKTFEIKADIIIGADGINSVVRSEIKKGLASDGDETCIVKGLRKTSDENRNGHRYRDRIDEQQTEDWGYKEVHVSSSISQKMHLRPNATHTWPRPDSLLIAFPNPDKSFTLMFNLPLAGKNSFATLISPETIEDYITKHFPDLTLLLPEIINSFLNKPTGNFTTLKTSPWYYKDFMVLIGDSAHAVIPFYGQGVCAAFEDCLNLSELIDSQSAIRNPKSEIPSADWETIFSLYQESRKKNTDILAQLSKDNFLELRDKSRSMFYIFKDKADTLLHRLFPKFWLPPLYVLIAHGTLEYQEAVKIHAKQQRLAKAIGLDAALYLMASPWLIAQAIGKLKVQN